MITIIGKGDNKYTREFATEAEAYDFLFSLVGRVYAFYHGITDEDLDFDIEDDLIIWRDESGQEKYCAGWHWPQHTFPDDPPGEDQIVMPGGVPLYKLFYHLEED